MPAEDTPKKLLFVINPISGGRDKSALPELIKEFCKKHSFIHFLIETNEEFKPTDIAEGIKKYEPQAVIACGGDGTVNLVGKELLNTDILLGIIPLGSSNALAKNLHVPLILEEAMATIKELHYKAIDTLKINERCCLHIFDIGFNANLVKRFHGSKLRGMISYGWYLFEELLELKFFKFKLESGGKHFNGKAFSITVTNSKSYGSRVEINPNGKDDDGKFEIAIVKSFPRIALISLFIKLMKGKLHHSRYSVYIRAQKALLTNSDCEGMHIDGEPVKFDKEINIRIMPKSLKVIVPWASEQS